MNIADELKKLDEMHRSGALSDDEFARAKATILEGRPLSQTPPPVQSVKSPETLEQETRQWAMFIHLSQLAGFMAPVVGLVLPIVLWQIKKNELPGVDVHGKNAVNWIISELIYTIICIPLLFILIGFALLAVLIIVGILFPVIAGLKANNGEVWEYPCSIKFIK